MKQDIRIVALLAIRNESLFIEKCLEHLYAQGIYTYVIDNESTDKSILIAEKFKKKGVIGIESLPFTGVFDLTAQLELKQKIAKSLEADWFIHHDADEIRYAPSRFNSLHDGILSADRAGYNAINFNEFVFLPTSKDESYEGTDYVHSMRHYYFFAPKPLRRINAWKNSGQEIDLISSGGHAVNFPGISIFPENFILRHYLALSVDHACQKYGTARKYSRTELQRGWHLGRAKFHENRLQFPNIDKMKIAGSEIDLDTSDPWKRHTIFGNDRFSKIMSRILKKIRNIKC